MTRRTFHRSGYALHDSAGGPGPGPAEPHHPLSSPGSAQAAPRRNQEAVARQKQPGWDEPEETLQARPMLSRRARTEMQQCNLRWVAPGVVASARLPPT